MTSYPCSPDQAGDTQFYEYRVDSVEEYPDSYTIQSNGGYLSIPKTVVPKAGMTARFYGKGLGYPVRGVFLDGQEVYYQTEQAHEAERQAHFACLKAERKAEADKNWPKTLERIKALPKVFQDRISGFMEFRPDFVSESLPYELFVCEQAVAISKLQAEQAIVTFANMHNYEAQKKIVPELADGHSGNSFHVACRLAICYLQEPALIPMMHGALCALTGCKDYGCYAARGKKA